MRTSIRAVILLAAIAFAVDGQAASHYEKRDLIVNVNTATTEELETIPCIGVKLAHEIIRGRPFKKVMNLKKVPGIGDYTFSCMSPFVKIEGPTERRPMP